MVKQNQRLIHCFQIAVDALVVFACFIFSVFFITGVDCFDIFALSNKIYLISTLFAVIISIITYRMFGLFKSYRKTRFLYELFTIIKANATLFFLMLSVSYLFLELNISLLFTFIITHFLVSSTYRYCLRRLLRHLRTKGYNRKYILIIGVNNTTESFAEKTHSFKEYGYEILGYIDNKERDNLNIKYLGEFSQLNDYLSKTLVDEAVIMLEDYSNEQSTEIINRCEYWGIKFSLMPSFFSNFGSRLYVSSFNGLPVFNVRQVPLDDRLNSLLKRAFDIILSLIFIIVFSPIMLIVAVAVKLSAKGNIFYKQTRVGLNRKTFEIYKFTSMRSDADKEKKFTTQNDDRCTSVGRFIRKYSIDELPQLFNVFFGDMSLVGPRPEIPHFVDEFRDAVPLYMVKHYIKPGMTGLAQINGLRGDTSIPKRIEFDINYIENWSIWLDIKILFLTVFKGIFNKNAY